MPLPLHDVTTLTEVFRRAVLRLLVRRELMDVETAHSMLAWPHSGFHVHDGVWVAADDREFAVRLARYCARNPVALSRLEYPSDDATVTYHSDKPTGPTAGEIVGRWDDRPAHCQPFHRTLQLSPPRELGDVVRRAVGQRLDRARRLTAPARDETRTVAQEEVGHVVRTVVAIHH